MAKLFGGGVSVEELSTINLAKKKKKRIPEKKVCV